MYYSASFQWPIVKILHLKMKSHTRLFKQQHSYRKPTEFGHKQAILNTVAGKTFSMSVNQWISPLWEKNVDVVSKEMESCHSFTLHKQYEADLEEAESSNNLWQINTKEPYFYLGRNRAKGLGKH